MKDPLIEHIEEFTGHAEQRRLRRAFLIWGVSFPLLVLLLICFLTSACTVHPTIRTSSGDIVSLGGSLGTKRTGDSASYSGAHGTLTYTSATNDETLIPRAYITGTNIKAGLAATTTQLGRAEVTKRALAKEETARVGIKSAASVEKLRITNPLPEAAAAAAVAP